MKRLLIPVLIAFIFSHLACALSESSISTSNEALEMLIAGDDPSRLDLKASEPDSFDHLNEVNDRSNKDEIEYRIASTELALGLNSKLNRLGADEVESNSSNASSDLGSYSTENLDRLLSGSEESEEVSGNDPFITSSYSASDMNSKLYRLCEGETDIDGLESDFWISSSGLGSDAGANLDRLLSERGTFGKFVENDTQMAYDREKSRDVNFNLIEDIYISSYAPSDQSNLYKYAENFVPNGAIETGIPTTSQDASSGNGANLENLSYRYESERVSDKKNTYIAHYIDSSLGYTKNDSAKEVLRNSPHFNSDLSSGHLDQLATSSGEIGHFKKYAHPEVDQNLDVLIQRGGSDEHIMPYLFSGWDAEKENGDKKDEYPKNSAVVVGINSYTDWSGLQSPVNDAREISKILGACGYEVLELTDETEMKPTKENILTAALDDIKTERIDGKIIFYFSGHGVRGDDGTFYLVPQDAKSDDLSSCISELELRGCLRDLDNLAVIIDACNSGDLKIADEGQLVLTSSKKDEPSNERWFGSMSVFTYNLCRAIEEEMLFNRNISLSECFYRAKYDTVRWSRWRLMSQTPEIIDFTGGNYYIK